MAKYRGSQKVASLIRVGGSLLCLLLQKVVVLASLIACGFALLLKYMYVILPLPRCRKYSLQLAPHPLYLAKSLPTSFSHRTMFGAGAIG